LVKLSAEEFMAMAGQANFGLKACHVIWKHLLSRGGKVIAI